MALSEHDEHEMRRIAREVAEEAVNEARTADGAALFLVDEETRRRIVALEAGQQALAAIASAIVDRLERMDDKLERMDATFARLMDMQSERISEVQTGLSERIDEVQAGLSERIDEVQAGLSEQITDVRTDFGAKLSVVDEKLDRLLDSRELPDDGQ